MISHSTQDPLATTRRFWNESPCDGQDDYGSRYRLRYDKEPWILDEIHHIAARHSGVLELGCGQGTDAFTFCRLLPPGGLYAGIDISERSVFRAAHEIAGVGPRLRVTPLFVVGNVEQLAITSESVGCVYSFGVLHHTADVRKAISEIQRVLLPGGKAYIYLYRTMSPKVFLARSMRGIQKVIDRLFGTEGSLFEFVRKHPMERHFGTMLLECAGVPYLNSYSRRQVEELVRGYHLESLCAVGNNFPRNIVGLRARRKSYEGRWGVFWRLELVKPAPGRVNGDA
jgi:ubiquinone/menaquinone biosynthesis C-methylase UbiE